MKKSSKHTVNIHKGIFCSNCDLNEIHGIRYKCLNCPGYNLCTICYILNKEEKFHQKTHHQFVAFGKPVNKKDVVHIDSICDGACRRDDSCIIGKRYRCTVCEDFDLCNQCYKDRLSFHENHKFKCIEKSTWYVKQKRENREVLIKPISFDCLGEIISFVRSSKIIASILRVSKNFNQYVEKENPKCCWNVKFNFNSKKKFLKTKKSCCYQLRINGDSFGCLLNFPNLFKLVIKDCYDLRDKHFRNLKYLQKLELDLYDETDLTGSFLLHLSELRILYLNNIREKFSPNCFKNLVNLKKLELVRVDRISDKIFKHLPNLKWMKLYETHKIRLDGFKHLKNLNYLEVLWCETIVDEQKIRDILPCDKEKLKFDAFRPWQGHSRGGIREIRKYREKRHGKKKNLKIF